MTDLEMARELTDMGYDVEYDESTGEFNETLLAEMAVNEGYRWDEVKEVWE